MLSKTAKYGIKAVIFIAHQSLQQKRVGVPEIALGIEAPQHFIGKIVQQLAKFGVLSSIKGPNGGFEMSEKQRKATNIRTIVEILDGPDLYTKCGLGLENCSASKPCPIHEAYAEVRHKIISMHTNASVDEMANDINDISFLK